MNPFENIPRGRLAWYLLGLVLALLAILGSCGCSPSAWTDLQIDPPSEEDLNQVPGTKRITVAWSPPCLGPEPPCGGPWTHYVLDLKKNKAAWTFELATEDTTAQLILQPGTWRARVAAVNDSIQGPYSEESDPLIIKAPVDPDWPDIHDPIHREEQR